ncbi:hypothetical protein D3C83_146720 [compost metagenome]
MIFCCCANGLSAPACLALRIIIWRWVMKVVAAIAITMHKATVFTTHGVASSRARSAGLDRKCAAMGAPKIFA